MFVFFVKFPFYIVEGGMQLGMRNEELGMVVSIADVLKREVSFHAARGTKRCKE